MKKILVILGPTSSGKTDLALDLAKQFNGELISVDSRQVYKGLDIGTGKLPSLKFKAMPEGRQVKSSKFDGYWVMDGVKIWMYDVALPKDRYDVSKYLIDVQKVLEGIFKRGKSPILVGGTGLYLKAILEGFNNLKRSVDLSLRKSLEKLSLTGLQERLKQLAPKVFEELNNSERNNKRRLVRKIEGRGRRLKVEGERKDWQVLKVGLTADREILNKRIDERVVDRVEQGMIEEAKSLNKNGLTFDRMRELGLEYKCLADLLEGKIEEEEFIKILQTKIHKYAKRQMTWFRNQEKDIWWVDITSDNFESQVEKKVSDWYNSSN